MTRPTPTAAELAIARTLERHFQASGREVSDVIVADAPDIRMTIGSKREGFECSQIPPDRIYKWINSKFKQLQATHCDFVRVVWPYEPHTWLRDAVEDKSRSVPQYLAESDCESVSLVIHSPLLAQNDFVKLHQKNVRELLGSTAQSLSTQYERLFFWDPKHGILQLTPAEDPWPTTTFDLSNGYPTNSFVMSATSFSTLAEGEEPITKDYGKVKPELIVVPPSSAEFSGLAPNYRELTYRVVLEIGPHSVTPTFEIIE